MTGVLVGIVTAFDLLNLLAKGAPHPAPNKERRAGEARTAQEPGKLGYQPRVYAFAGRRRSR
jgi:hypothetical protein